MLNQHKQEKEQNKLGSSVKVCPNEVKFNTSLKLDREDQDTFEIS